MCQKKKLDYLIDLWFLFLKNSARLVPLDAISLLKKVLGSPSIFVNIYEYLVIFLVNVL